MTHSMSAAENREEGARQQMVQQRGNTVVMGSSRRPLLPTREGEDSFSVFGTEAASQSSSSEIESAV
jgi:hypothetical protein